MEGRVVARSRRQTDRRPFRSLAFPREPTRDRDPRQGCSGPTGPVKPRPVAQREDKAGLSGSLGPLPRRGEVPAAPRARQHGSLWESGE